MPTYIITLANGKRERVYYPKNRDHFRSVYRHEAAVTRAYPGYGHIVQVEEALSGLILFPYNRTPLEAVGEGKQWDTTRRSTLLPPCNRKPQLSRG